MKKIKVNIQKNFCDGKQFTFRAPWGSVGCKEKMYVIDNSTPITDSDNYDIVDAGGDVIVGSGLLGAWKMGAMISAILDITNKKVYIQNARQPLVNYGMFQRFHNKKHADLFWTTIKDDISEIKLSSIFATNSTMGNPHEYVTIDETSGTINVLKPCTIVLDGHLFITKFKDPKYDNGIVFNDSTVELRLGQYLGSGCDNYAQDIDIVEYGSGYSTDICWDQGGPANPQWQFDCKPGEFCIILKAYNDVGTPSLRGLATRNDSILNIWVYPTQ